MSQAAFARSRGWARSYVTKLKHEGRLVMNADGTVDVLASLARIEATAAHSRPDAAARAAAARQGTADAAPRPSHSAGPAPFTPDPDLVNAPPASGEHPAEGAGDQGAQLRRVRELIIREQRVIELGRLRGELLERGDVDHAYAALGTALRAGLEASVERLAPVLAAAPDRAAAAALIHAELRDQRRRFTRALVAAARDSAREAA